LRQFNRTLAAKIEQNLPDCSVLSLAWHSAATYAAVALDPSCFRGLQFPETDGPLTGFVLRDAQSSDLAGRLRADAERRLGGRIVAIDGKIDFDPAQLIPRGAQLIVYGPIDRVRESGPRQTGHGPHTLHRRIGRRLLHRLLHREWRLRRTDPIFGTFLAIAVSVYLLGTWYFRHALKVDWLTAAYFVTTTMTTTGYGDIMPSHDHPIDVLVAMMLMLCGIISIGIFTAFVASRLTRAQWVRMQGLRRVRRHGHIVVCGAGSIGSGVIDLLLAFDRPLVVVEVKPDTVLVEQARKRGFDLLTGDASRDDTLDMCNLAAAHSLVALTNVDTLNLEIALGARARNPDLPIVLRIAEAAFAASIAAHFDLKTTFSVAALASPVFASLSRFDGGLGRISFDGQEFAIGEGVFTEHYRSIMPEGALPLAVSRDGDFALIQRFDELRVGDQALLLVPLAPFYEGRDSLAAAADRRAYRRAGELSGAAK